MFLTCFLLVLTSLKIWISRYLPLLGDEAYYNLWSKHLSLSYNDHPPMIAYIHAASNYLFGQTEFGIRLSAIVLLLVSSFLIYIISKEIFNKKAAIYSVCLFNLIPTFAAGGVFLTPEQPLAIFWLLSVFLSIKLIKTHEPKYWYALGSTIGLGLLSKYPMFLFIPGLLLFLFLSKEHRYWFFRKEFYLSMLIALFIFSPVLVWNYQQHFSSFLYHESRIGSTNYLNNLLYFFVLQFIMYSPILFIFTFKNVLFKAKHWIDQADNIALFSFTLPLPGLLAFTLISPFTMVGGHWTSILYLTPLIMLTHELVSPKATKFRLYFNVFVVLSINILFIGYYAFLFPIPKTLGKQAYRVNQQLEQYIRSQKPNYVFSDQMGVASLVAFYGKTDVYMPKGLWKQFDVWGQPTLKKGDNVLFFGFEDNKITKEFAQCFRQTIVDPQIRLFAKDANIPNKTKVYLYKEYNK